VVGALKPSHLGRYKQVAGLLIRHGRSDLLRDTGLADITAEEGGEETVADAERLTDDLEALGPTFVKLGQLLSTRADLLPAPYLEALSRLQDDVEPLPFATIEEVLSAELAAPPGAVFAEFDEEPLAAASLAQVHRARLGSGREVAVKVQRPGIRERVAEDLEVLGSLADLLDRHTDVGRHYRFGQLHAEFRRALLRELDFGLEAGNLERLAANLAGFDDLVVPQPVRDCTTSRVLTMDHIDGRKITELNRYARFEIEGAVLAEALFGAYLQQILVDGFFHADPHPGNILLTTDGRLALIDLGMTARLPQSIQDRIVRLLVAVSERNADEVAAAAAELGEPQPDFDKDRFAATVAELVGRVDGTGLGEMQVGSLVLELSRTSGEQGLRPASELAVLGKTLLNLDEIGRTLDPTLEPNAVISERISVIVSERMSRDFTLQGAARTMLDAKEFVARLPARMNRIMDTVAEGKLEVKVDAIDEHELMRMAQKVANRVTAGLVLAALIVGASMLMQVDVEPRLFGYPALAIVLFLGAAAAGFGLLLSILFGDEHGRR
jgi:ubiquinone biosynthesis protein